MIATLNENDIARLLEIEACTNATGWSANSFAKEIGAENSQTYGYFQHESSSTTTNINTQSELLCGFVSVRRVLDEIFIYALAVHPDCQRRGVAKALVEKILADNPGCWVTLEVRKNNEVARRFYSAMGFQEIGNRPAYYRNPVDDAILMSKRVLQIEEQTKGKKLELALQ